MVWRVGAHVTQKKVLASADSLGIDMVQIFQGNPRRWELASFNKDMDAINDAKLRVYVHSPYLINIASSKFGPQLSSTALLMHQLQLSAGFSDCPGVVVHGGVSQDGDTDAGRKRWSRIFTDYELPNKILIECAANGKRSMTRHLDDIEKLWSMPGVAEKAGFVLDTAHAWASGHDHLVLYVKQLREIVGKIDLVHANGSSVTMKSGTDAHSPFADSLLGLDLVTEMIEESECEDLIVESRDPTADILALKEYQYAG